MDKMINRLWPILFLFITSCENDCKPIASPCHSSIVFLDKSISVDGQDARMRAVLEGYLNPFLASVVSNPGDMVEAHLIHGQSIGAKVLFQKTWTEQPPCEAEMGPDSYEQAKEAYQVRLKRFRTTILNELLNCMQQKATENVVHETDMLGTLEIISEFFKDKHVPAPRTVLYISDMVHSQKNPRDYFKSPPKDRGESETCAKQDLAWLKTNHKVDASKFDSLDIKIWFTGIDYAKTQNEQMKYYWSTLFNDLNTSTKVTFQ